MGQQQRPLGSPATYRLVQELFADARQAFREMERAQQQGRFFGPEQEGFQEAVQQFLQGVHVYNAEIGAERFAEPARSGTS